MYAIHTNADYNTPHTHIYMPHICYTHKLRCCMPHIRKHTLHTTLIHMPHTNIDVTCHINTSHTPHTRHIPHYTPSLTDAHTTSIHTHHIHTPHIYTLCTLHTHTTRHSFMPSTYHIDLQSYISSPSILISTRCHDEKKLGPD